jgi:hypothetical protein
VKVGVRATWLVPASALALLAIAVALLWVDLAPEEREAIAAMATPPRVGLVVLLVLAVAGVLGVAAHRMIGAPLAVARRASEAVRLAVHGNPAHRAVAEGPAELRELIEAVNDVAARRSELLEDVKAAVADAKSRV